MKSIINYSNSNRVNIKLLIPLLFIYICPNIKLLSQGENSLIPISIILVGFSFLKKNELITFISICALALLNLLIQEPAINTSSVLSTLISIYIICVPVGTSIILGRIIGCKYANASPSRLINDIQFISLVLITILFTSYVLDITAPYILQTFIFAGRSSHERIPFIFTEPSQASSFILGLLLVGILVLKSSYLEKFTRMKSRNLSLLIIGIGLVVFYFSQPLTGLAQLILSLLIIIFLISMKIGIDLLFKFKINMKQTGILAIKNNKLKSFIIVFIIIPSLLFLIINFSQRTLGLISVLGRTNLIDSLFIGSGFRLHYSFVSVVKSFTDPISLPGNWSNSFTADLVNVLRDYNILTSNFSNILYLDKPATTIKPVGWLYFTLYDLGIIGTCLFFVGVIGKKVKKLLKEIIKINYLIITIFSIQIAVLIIPTLPSTPTVFFPILIIETISYYKKYNKSMVII